MAGDRHKYECLTEERRQRNRLLGGHIKSLMDDAGRHRKLLKDAADADAEGVDVAVIDLEMPLISGVEVYARLQKGHDCPSIIVAKTAPGTNALDALNDVAVTGILSKPFDPVALLDRLEQLVD